MARRVVVKDAVIVSMRIPRQLYETVRDISVIETNNTGRNVTAHELIRDALKFVYEDNERLRECFRRTRIKGRVRHKKNKYWR